mmetsp:Transcript_20915/g.53602  ORF Transcript_20915/g.53602 Transcript_20915/m.53602 type:complete len:219 (+) Transcript_20915:1086-1742(+)
MWFLRCLPMTLPLLPMTTAVFQMVSPCAASRSRMGLTMTMLYLRAMAWHMRVAGPVSAHSANSSHCFSRVQNAKGMVHASWRQSTFTPSWPACSMMAPTFSNIARRWSAYGSVVASGTLFWITPTRVTRGGVSCIGAAANRNAFTSKSPPCGCDASAAATTRPALKPYRYPRIASSSLAGKCASSSSSTLSKPAILPSSVDIFADGFQARTGGTSSPY